MPNHRAEISGAPGTVACREYEYLLPDGTEAAVAVTLRDLADHSDGAKTARQNGALAHGLISVVGVRDAPSRPLAWMQTKDELVVLVGRDDQPMSDDLHQTLVRVLRIFFKEMRAALLRVLRACGSGDGRDSVKSASRRSS